MASIDPKVSLVTKGMAPIDANKRVNEPDSWRFRCPDQHTCIKWNSAISYYCKTCNESFPIGELVDLKHNKPLREVPYVG